ncbi:MAG: HEPN domain-containing protein [Candidatus Micrarchaeota archaeon]
MQPDARLAESLFASAEKDLIASGDNLSSGHPDWALAIAYNAMLSAGRALMARKGYRATSEAHHVAVVQFCAASLPRESCGLVASFNRYRVRRHDVVYGETDSVGEDEANRAIGNAKMFVKAVQSLK